MDLYRILLLEDDPAMGQSLLDGFKQNGFRAELTCAGFPFSPKARRVRNRLKNIFCAWAGAPGATFCANHPIISSGSP